MSVSQGETAPPKSAGTERDAELGATHQGDQSAFALASQFHANAGHCRIATAEIDYAPMSEVAQACAAIFRSVDRDDAVQRAVARDAWLLKTTLALTALPFEDPRIGLLELVRKLEHAAEGVPIIRGAVAALGSIVTTLRANLLNPKRRRILELLKTPEEASQGIAVLATLCGSSTPGWPAGLDLQRDFGCGHASPVRTRKDLRNSSFSLVLVPGNPRFANRGIILDLLYGGRAPQAIVLSYRAEQTDVPRPVAMPRDRFFEGVRTGEPGVHEDKLPSEEVQIDEWAHDSFWESVRARHGNVVPLSDRDVTVAARFVLFADGSGAFLPENGRIVEISDRFDPGMQFRQAEERLPRKDIRDLEEGDLVMMRLTGSGDYLDEVADSLMSQAGEAALRACALQWKDRLHEALKRHGEGVLASRLREAGVPIRSAQYLWEWAGDAVMAPQDLKTFLRLIAVVWQVGAGAADIPSEAYANERWKEMERVKSYQLRAGIEIRAALLTRVRSLIAARQRVETVQSIELPGVQAGRMGLMRVSAIDGKPMRVPISKLFHLEKVR